MTQTLTIRDHLRSDKFRERIASVMPKHCTSDRMIAVALAAVSRTPQLQDKRLDQASFFKAMMACSELGLEPDGRLAHLIPFNNRKRNCIEVQLIIDYKGLVQRAYRSGEVTRIHADVVYKEDEFDYQLGKVVSHRPFYLNGIADGGPVIGAYCVVEMKNGAEKHEFMPTKDIESVRNRSANGKSDKSPWASDWNEMAKKTVFRRAEKWIPSSAEWRSALELDGDRLEAPVSNAPAVPRINLTPTPEPPKLTEESPEAIGEWSEDFDPEAEPGEAEALEAIADSDDPEFIESHLDHFPDSVKVKDAVENRIREVVGDEA